MVELARIRMLLLGCGVLSSLVWIGNDIVAGMLWQGYSFTDQAISELSGVGAPTRSLVVSVLLVYDVLLLAFGFGIWAQSRQRALRLIGGIMVTIGVLGLVGMPFPLQLGVTEASFSNTMHSIIAGVVGLLFLLGMGLGAFANGKRFRLLSAGLLLALIVAGGVSAVMAGVDISQRGFETPPPLFGLLERIDVYGSMLWVMVLSVILLRAEKRLSVHSEN